MTTPNASRVAARHLEAIRFPTMPRSSFVPTHMRGKETNVDPQGTDLAIMTWEDGDRLMGVAFSGNSNKPIWHYRFRSEAERQREIDQTIAARKSTLQRKTERVQERKDFQHDVQVGDIFYTSWGYDQTNVDFYEVTALKAKAIVIREVASKSIREERGADYVSAVPGAYVGPPMTKVVQMGNHIKIESQHASKWDGKPKYETASGYGH